MYKGLSAVNVKKYDISLVRYLERGGEITFSDTKLYVQLLSMRSLKYNVQDGSWYAVNLSESDGFLFAKFGVLTRTRTMQDKCAL